MEQELIQAPEFEHVKQPLMDHVLALRSAMIRSAVLLIAAMGIGFLFIEPIYQFLVEPLAKAQGTEGERLIYTGLTEAFFTYLKLSWYVGLAITLPWILGELYCFLAPGLYRRERLFLAPFLLCSPVLFIGGAALAYYHVIPMAWQFFVGFEYHGSSGIPIELEARVSEYLSIVLQLMLAFGLAFQLPIALILLARFGIVTPQFLAAKRKYAFIIILIAAAILTPPDVFSQIALAVPLQLLYELSIILCRLLAKKPNPVAADDAYDRDVRD